MRFSDFEIEQISPKLFYVRWFTAPKVGSPCERNYVNVLKDVLSQAPQPIYLISDLRRGRISNALVLRELGQLTAHPMLAGSTGFSSDPVTNLMVSVFKQYARRLNRDSRHETWETPEQAIAYLETLEEGISEGLDWQRIIAGQYPQPE